MAPLISVIVPIHNVAAYLRPCVESILAQTERSLEVICVDDASTDSSATIISELAAEDDRVRVLRNTRNLGLSTTRNVGIEAAGGEWLLFVDSDDLIDPSVCSKAMTAARSENADLVLFDFISFIDGMTPYIALARPSEIDRSRASDRRYLLSLRYYAWTKLVKASLMRSKSIRFPDGLCFEDIYVHWRLVLDAPTVAIVPEQLYYYRQRTGSLCDKRDWSRTDSIFVYDMVRDHLLQNDLYCEYRNLFLSRRLANLRFVYDIVHKYHRRDVLELIHDRLGPDEWEYICGANCLRWQDRDFFLALRGAARSKVRRAIWLLACACRRRLSTTSDCATDMGPTHNSNPAS